MTRTVSAPAVVIAETFPLGELPPPGQIPERMIAQVIRRERYNLQDPAQAFAIEEVATPLPGPGEALVAVMAAGVNFNNVWSARGIPVDVIKARQKAGAEEDFHIGGSDASGIVQAVGEGVTNVKVGEKVVAHCGTWDADDPSIKSRRNDPILGDSARIWGYETNYGSFAQYTRVQSHQLVPKPDHLTWEQSAAYMLVGATAYRMLCGFPENEIQAGDVVLVWGAKGGLGSQAIQIAKAKGAIPVAVVSNDEHGKWCMELGAKGYINRDNFTHWGLLPDTGPKGAEKYAEWLSGARAFGRAIWDIVGERKNPRIVFEHPGEATIPTSVYVCDRGGMVVICAGTSGFRASADLRHLWMNQIRLEGSHFANDVQATALNDMVRARQVDPCLSRTFSFKDTGLAHQLMFKGKLPPGNVAVLVGAQPNQLG